MWTRLLCLVFLGIEAVSDARHKKIKVWHICVAAAVAAIVWFLQKDVPWKSLLAGAGIGAFLVILSLLLPQKLGVGDGLAVLVCGLYLGWNETLATFFYGTVLAGLYAIVLLAGKCSGKRQIPFIPFLLAGYVFTLFISEV